MGYIRKALEKGFLKMYGNGGGSGTGFFPFENWPLLLIFLGFVVRFQTFFPPPPPHPTPITGCALGGGGLRNPPTYFGGGKFKKLCFGEGWDSGKAI